VQVIETVETWRKALDNERASGREVGLVPTMGFLHAGHASLIRRAASECDAVAVTIFVNPLQFGPTEDLGAYPRDLDGDCTLAGECGATHVFAPTVDEMYPSPPLTSVEVAEVSERWEGASRPGHFAGVATVVAKLFAQAGPCRAYFGEKDFQQLAVIRRMAHDLSFPVDVIGCPTVREDDGLALSSRNVYLTPEERASAPTLYRALCTGASTAAQPGATPADVDRAMVETVASVPSFALDYAAIVDAATLAPAERLTGDLRLIIAARLGRARLIDNLGVQL
jgi:pantoate--beta-alanine ligase